MQELCENLFVSPKGLTIDIEDIIDPVDGIDNYEYPVVGVKLISMVNFSLLSPPEYNLMFSI